MLGMQDEKPVLHRTIGQAFWTLELRMAASILEARCEPFFLGGRSEGEAALPVARAAGCCSEASSPRALLGGS